MTVIPRRPAPLFAALVALLLVATPVAAHAELTEADPADGSEVSGPFEGPITLSFSEALADNSGARLLDGEGDEVAQATIPADEPAQLVFELDQPLEPGSYRIEITAIADDGHIERPIVEFTVLEPPPTPSPAPSETPATSDPQPSASPAPTPAPSPAPSPSPSGDGPPTASAGDVVLPIVAALIAVALLAAVLLRSRRNRGA
jgi:methionine-rich copper-binding protein CopC